MRLVSCASRARPSKPRNPYDLGALANFKEAFDVQETRLWWIRWCLPSLKPKRGNGYRFLRRRGSSSKGGRKRMVPGVRDLCNEHDSDGSDGYESHDDDDDDDQERR